MNKLKMAAALGAAALWCSSAGAVPVEMRWDGIAAGPPGVTSATVFFSYEDSVADSNPDPILNMFEGALTSFTTVLGDGTTWTLDPSQPTYMRLSHRGADLTSVRLGGTLLSPQSPGEEFDLQTSIEISYSGSYDTLTELATSGWEGWEFYFLISSETGGRILQNGAFSVLSVPEPSSLALLSLGLIGVAVRRNWSGSVDTARALTTS